MLKPCSSQEKRPLTGREQVWAPCVLKGSSQEWSLCHLSKLGVGEGGMFLFRYYTVQSFSPNFYRFSCVFVVVQLRSCFWLSATLWTLADQSSLSFIISQSLLKLMSIEWVMPSNHLIFCHPLLLLPVIFPSIRVFSNESALCIRWTNYSSFNFGIGPSNEYSRLISFRIDWFALLAVLVYMFLHLPFISKTISRGFKLLFLIIFTSFTEEQVSGALCVITLEARQKAAASFPQTQPRASPVAVGT